MKQLRPSRRPAAFLLLVTPALLHGGCAAQGPCLQYGAISYERQIMVQGMGTISMPVQGIVCTQRSTLAAADP